MTILSREPKRILSRSSRSRLRAMLLNHLGYMEKGRRLEMTVDMGGQLENKLEITGRANGCMSKEFSDYLMKPWSFL